MKIGEFTLSGTAEADGVVSSVGDWKRRFPIALDYPPGAPLLLRGRLEVGEAGLEPVVEEVWPLDVGVPVDVNEAWVLFRPRDSLSVVAYTGEDPLGRRFLVEANFPLAVDTPYWLWGLVTVRNYPLLGVRWIFRSSKSLALKEFPKM